MFFFLLDSAGFFFSSFSLFPLSFVRIWIPF